MVKKRVVILGAGFVGIRCAQDLCRLAGDRLDITLVDKNSFHLFHADLYEVATCFNKKIHGECRTRLKETVATPIEDLIDRSCVKFVEKEVLGIDASAKVVRIKGGQKLDYDYLVCGLGSVVEDYGISGLKENAFPLKNLADGIRLNCYVDQFFHDLWNAKQKREVFITIAGGGPTGVELAAELSSALKIICRKYRFKRKDINLQIIEGGTMLGGLSEKGTRVVKQRLQKLGIKVYLKRRIQRVGKKKVFVKLADGAIDEFDSDITIWTGGVRVNPVVGRDLGDADKGGKVLVNQFLQADKWGEVFAAGDNAFVFHADGRPFPGLAQIARKQGRVIAENIVALNDGKLMKDFKLKKWHFVLPVGGKFGVWEVKDKVYKGFFVWVIRRMVFLMYVMSILPFFAALRKWLRTEQVFMDND